MRYVKHMDLNTIRLEGKLENDEFFELADQQGILRHARLVLLRPLGEVGQSGTPRTTRSPPNRLRRPDPPAAQPPERLRLAERQRQPAACRSRAGVPGYPEEPATGPIRSSRRPPQNKAEVSGPSGVKMTRPLRVRAALLLAARHEERRRLRLRHRDQPGPPIPPVESMKADAARRAPLADRRIWNYPPRRRRAFKDLTVFTEALERALRDSRPASRTTRARPRRSPTRASAPCSRPTRRNKYISTGVIQWMLNNAWPSMIWHLYDYYLRPGGGYFGTKKACEPLHVQYSYDDRSVVVVNDSAPSRSPASRLPRKVLDFDLDGEASPRPAMDRPPPTAPPGFSTSPRSPGMQHDLLPATDAPDGAGNVRSSQLLLAVARARRPRQDEDRVVLHAHQAPRRPDGAQLAARDDARARGAPSWEGDGGARVHRAAQPRRRPRLPGPLKVSTRRPARRSCRCTGTTTTSRCCPARPGRSAPHPRSTGRPSASRSSPRRGTQPPLALTTRGSMRSRIIVLLVFLIFFVISFDHQHPRAAGPRHHRRLRPQPGARRVPALLLLRRLRRDVDSRRHAARALPRKRGDGGRLRARLRRLAAVRLGAHLHGGAHLAVPHRHRHDHAAGGDQPLAAHGRRRGALRLLLGDGPAGVRPGLVPQPAGLLLSGGPPPGDAQVGQPAGQLAVPRRAARAALGVALLGVRRLALADGGAARGRPAAQGGAQGRRARRCLGHPPRRCSATATVGSSSLGIFCYVGTEQGVANWISKFLRRYHGFDPQATVRGRWLVLGPDDGRLPARPAAAQALRLPPGADRFRRGGASSP